MVPTGPTVVALPEKGKSLNEFQQQDFSCRDYAFRTVNGSGASQAAQANSVNSAALGTAGGAAVGALLGTAGGNAGAGAAIGAGSGLLVGSAVGAGAAQTTTDGLQARYDTSYAQCMASKGNSIAQGQPVVYSSPPVIYNAPVIYGLPPGPRFWGPGPWGPVPWAVW
jgi:hypothetical protein